MAFASRKTHSILCVRQIRERTIQLESQTRSEIKQKQCIKKSWSKVQKAIAGIITQSDPLNPLNGFPMSYQLAAAVYNIPDFEIEF